jgi:hypothetical protein
VDDLHEWHNKTDADGYRPGNEALARGIHQGARRIYLQIEIQAEILRHMEKMEEYYRNKPKKEGSNGSNVAGAKP